MDIALWVLQGLLALAFGIAGVLKLTKPKAQLEEKMSWTRHASPGQIKLVGFVELLGAIGLILPGVLDIAPWLVAVAAAGLALTMVGAMITHNRIGHGIEETKPAIMLFVLTLVLAIGRGFIAPL